MRSAQPTITRQLRVPPNVLSPTERFVLPIGTRVYAMANGVVVAAQFALSNNPASSGFLLVRHEVFHHGAANRIDYDLAPAFVWTLIYFLDNAGFSIPAAPPAAAGATSGANPDWLNRFIMRLRECELAVQYHNANAANAALTRGWAHNPSGAGPRLATGQEIEQDATAYRALANDLQLGRPVLFPLEANPVPTPVRVILGDFLRFPNRMAQNQDGIRIEIFSNAELDVPNSYSPSVFGKYRGLVEGCIRRHPARSRGRDGSPAGRCGVALSDDRFSGVDQQHHMGLGVGEIRCIRCRRRTCSRASTTHLTTRALGDCSPWPTIWVSQFEMR